MIAIDVEIEGVSSLLMNPKGDELAEQIASGVHRARARDVSVYVEAAGKLIIIDEKIVLPRMYLFAALAYAGRRVEFNKKRMVSTTRDTRIPSFLDILDPYFPIYPYAWDVDIQGAKNPVGGQAVVAVRPRFDYWGFKTTIIIKEEVFSVEKTRRLFDLAGKMSGLGDFRPGTGGKYGCFRVAHWEVK